MRWKNSTLGKVKNKINIELLELNSLRTTLFFANSEWLAKYLEIQWIERVYSIVVTCNILCWATHAERWFAKRRFMKKPIHRIRRKTKNFQKKMSSTFWRKMIRYEWDENANSNIFIFISLSKFSSKLVFTPMM